MPIDASIPMGLHRSDELAFTKRRQVNNQSRLLDEQVKSAKFERGQKEWENARKMKLGQLLSAPGTSKQRRQSLLDAGFGAEANKLREDDQKYATGQLDNAKKAYEVVSQATNAIGAIGTEEGGLNVLTALSDKYGIETDVYKQQLMQQGNDPARIKEWAARMQLDAKEELLQTETTDLGGTIETRSVDPVTGKSTLQRTDTKTMDAAQKASNQIAQANLGLDRQKLAFEQEKYIGEQATSKAEAMLEEDEAAKIQFNADLDLIEDAGLVMDIADDSLDFIDRYDPTGTAAHFSGLLPGTKANDLEKMLTTLKGRVASKAIKDLRKSSSSGATGFGALNKEELNLLQSALGNLDISQGTKRLSHNINVIRDSFEKAKFRTQTPELLAEIDLRNKQVKGSRTKRAVERKERLAANDDVRKLQRQGIKPDSPKGRDYLARAKRQRGGNESAAQPKPDWTGNDMPPANQMQGAMMFDKETGRQYQSDGTSWVDITGQKQANQ